MIRPVEYVKGAIRCVGTDGADECQILAHRTIRRWGQTWGPYCIAHHPIVTEAMEIHGRTLIEQET